MADQKWELLAATTLLANFLETGGDVSDSLDKFIIDTQARVNEHLKIKNTIGATKILEKATKALEDWSSKLV